MRAIDATELSGFQARLRRRYSDEEILAELSDCAKRLGRSPTMREFVADEETTVHPQTVVGRFGSWNTAKRAAGLQPRRFATREDLRAQLRALAVELGRAPTSADIDARRGSMASKSLFWHAFGSLANALREAGLPVAGREERLEAAVDHGAALARRLGRLPRFADWAAARATDETLPSQWQVYRLAGGRRGAWATFQLLVRDRVVESGGEVAPDGALRRKGGGARERGASSPRQRARRAASGRTGARRARGLPGAAPR